MADTRKDKRAPVSLKVRFKSATVDEFIEQYCRDVSRGGIFIKSSQPMAVGTLLKFQLQLKDESSLIKGVGRVVWTRSEDDASSEAPAGMGIKFIKMDGESRVVVDRIIGGHDGEPGTFDQGEPMQSDAPPANGSGSGFFPNLPPPVLPPPEDRTAVRHAAQFLASALSESGTDQAASQEAEQKAEEARRRTAQIQAQREAEAEQKKKAQAGDALPSMIIDPSLSMPPPAADAASGSAAVDEDRPTSSDPSRAPASDRPTSQKEKPKAKPQPKPAEPNENTGVTERKKVDVAAIATGAIATEQPAKPKSNTLPYFVIAVVVAGAAFMALRSDEPPVAEQEVLAPAVDEPTPEPTLEPAVVAPEAVPEPTEPAPAAEPVVLTSIKVTTSPDGAEIFVGSESRGNAPLTLELAEGVPVTLRARTAGRADATQEITPAAGQKPIKLTLGTLPYVLRVESTPSGATVFVGTKRGTTPVDLELPTPKGPLKVTTRLDGYGTVVKTVAASSFVENDGALRSELNLTLSENKPAPTAAPKPASRPRPVKPEAEPAPVEAAPKPSEPAPAPSGSAPTPGDPMPEPKPVETAPKAKPKPEPASKPAPAAEPPIPDNPFG